MHLFVNVLEINFTMGDSHLFSYSTSLVYFAFTILLFRFYRLFNCQRKFKCLYMIVRGIVQQQM